MAGLSQAANTANPPKPPKFTHRSCLEPAPSCRAMGELMGEEQPGICSGLGVYSFRNASGEGLMLSQHSCCCAPSPSQSAAHTAPASCRELLPLSAAQLSSLKFLSGDFLWAKPLQTLLRLLLPSEQEANLAGSSRNPDIHRKLFLPWHGAEQSFRLPGTKPCCDCVEISPKTLNKVRAWKGNRSSSSCCSPGAGAQHFPRSCPSLGEREGEQLAKFSCRSISGATANIPEQWREHEGIKPGVIPAAELWVG